MRKKSLRCAQAQYDWGKGIRACRLKKKMSQGDIFRATGLERSFISRLESGKVADPRIKTVLKIANALGVSVAEIAACSLIK